MKKNSKKKDIQLARLNAIIVMLLKMMFTVFVMILSSVV